MRCLPTDDGRLSQRSGASSHLVRMDRKLQGRAKTRVVVLQGKLAPVQMSDRCREGEAQSCALFRAAGIETAKAAERLASKLSGNARASIRHLNPNRVSILAERDLDFGAFGVAHGVLDEIAERLRQQLPMAVEWHWTRRPAKLQGCPCLFGEWLVHFGELRDELAAVEPAELLAPCQSF